MSLPPITPATTPSEKKGGKHDPSIVQKLRESDFIPEGQQVKSNPKGVRVLIYIDPDYFKGKSFKEAIRSAKALLEQKGVIVLDAGANPIVAVVPDERTLTAAESLTFVAYVRDGEIPLAQPTAGSVLSQGVYNISAHYAWSKGYNGSGVRVGVLDIPSGVGGFSNYQNLIQAGELPQNTQLYADYGTGSGVHGSACAEIIYDVAPGIDGMYLGVYSTTEEMYNVTKWFADNGVKVVSHSISNYGWGPSQFDTDNDGIPEFWDVYRVINHTLENGIVWVNAAGNGRDKHWEGDWKDADGDGYLDIYGTASDSSSVELDREAIQVVLNSGVSRTFQAWIRWTDYPYPARGPTNDFDAYLLCDNGSAWETVASSEDLQNGAFGQEPLEYIYFDLASKGWDDGENHHCMLVVTKNNAPDANSMHFDIWWTKVAGYWYRDDGTYRAVVEEGSVSPPGDHPGVLTVGAVNWKDVSTPENFSAMGPAYNPYLQTGYWLKPNVVAPDGVATYSLGSFSGTSAAAPHVAGVVADVLSARSTITPDTMIWIIEKTSKDINATGADYYTGYGLVNASDATPQRVGWTYPTPERDSIVDVQEVTLNVTTWYKQLNQSNLTLDGTTYRMTGSSNLKSWWTSLSDLPEGEHVYNATTLDRFKVWTVQTYSRRFYVNLGTKNPTEGIDGDAVTGPGGAWANDETIAPDSSGIVDGTFVWKDANDAYTSPCTGRTYNITEVQLRADGDHIYVLVKFKDTLPIGTNPAPLVGVGFDTDNDGNLDYRAYAFLNKPGVSDGNAEFLDVYDSSWNNVANGDPSHTVFVALNNVVEMQIPLGVIGSPSGTIGISAWVYEGLGAERICYGSDSMTDNGNTLTTVDLAQVPFSPNISLLVLATLGIVAYLRKQQN
ncbi:S8 family serine peptidase [Thermococcus cleftensis]|uniref:S8 family serine peptidase n=1 Tax=Thermococcus cleftensis (strain DSM 27260 / KACC 17922 / CL1) TaxID=163003 RepID=UPI001F032567|nr:S8 family serine peptidase [Thermococcus cleftensis]